jgi:hypothetical protein
VRDEPVLVRPKDQEDNSDANRAVFAMSSTGVCKVSRWHVWLLGTFAFVILLMSVSTVPPASEPHANCCLCMCHAKDETTCARYCIVRQHGTKIVEEPEMNVCTELCRRKGVEQTQ